MGCDAAFTLATLIALPLRLLPPLLLGPSGRLRQWRQVAQQSPAAVQCESHQHMPAHACINTHTECISHCQQQVEETGWQGQVAESPMPVSSHVPHMLTAAATALLCGVKPACNACCCHAQQLHYISSVEGTAPGLYAAVKLPAGAAEASQAVSWALLVVGLRQGWVGVHYTEM